MKLQVNGGLVDVQRVQEQLPDLVICNIRMPELDGYSILTTLRQDPVERDDSLHFSHSQNYQDRASLRHGTGSG